MVMLGRWRCAASNPVEKVGVRAFEQRLVAVELAAVETGKMGIGKATENQVGLPRAPMPGTEREPLAADIR